MNIFRTWKLFHGPLRYYDGTCYRLNNLAAQLNRLNERRKSIQREIIALSEGNQACAECQGLCCKGDYDHFTAIDYLVRRFSNNPIEQYGGIWKRDSILLRVWKEIRRPGKRDMVLSDAGNTGCINQTDFGCSLKQEDRPIRCILWTCKAYRKSLSRENLFRIGLLTKELVSLCSEVSKIFMRI